MDDYHWCDRRVLQFNAKNEPVGFTCPRCAEHYDIETFVSLNRMKYDKTADLESEEE